MSRSVQDTAAKEKSLAYNRKWYAEHAETQKAAAKKWRQENREKVRQCHRAWRAKNEVKLKEQRKRYYGKYKGKRKIWREANRDRINAKNKEHRLANLARYKERVLVYRNKNKERINRLARDFRKRTFFYFRAIALKITTKEQLARLWKNQKGRCVLTGRKLDRRTAHLDHKIPVANGGTHDIFNLRWLHKDVNFAKRSLSDEDFIQLCKEVAGRNLDPDRV